MSGGGPALFALSGARALGERVAAALGEPLWPHEERDFEDGEHKSRPLGSVRGRDVFVLQGLRGGDGQSVNDRLCRLLFFCGALRDASAASITVVAPYLCYSRKDRRTKSRDPVTTRYVAQVLEAVAVERVVTLDVHNPAAFENAFRCRTEHLEARPLLVAHLAAALAGEPVTVVAPDAGGAKRADALRASLSEVLGARVASAYAEKERSGGVVTGDLLVGDLDGRVAVIVDDLIATGTTIARTARRCLAMGARRVLAAVTHGVFAQAADEALADPALAGLIVTDSAEPRELTTAAAAAKLTVLPIAPFLAAAIRRLHEGGSLVDLHESWTGAQPMARARSRASNA